MVVLRGAGVFAEFGGFFLRLSGFVGGFAFGFGFALGFGLFALLLLFWGFGYGVLVGFPAAFCGFIKEGADGDAAGFYGFVGVFGVALVVGDAGAAPLVE